MTLYRNTEGAYKTAYVGVLNDTALKKDDRDTIIEMHDYCIMAGQKKKTLMIFMYNLRRCAKLVYRARKEATLKTATKDDIRKMVVSMEQDTKYPYHAKREIKKSLKKFDKLLNGEYSDLTKWICTTDKSKKLPKVYTERELTAIFDNIPDKDMFVCLITLYESSLRIGEHLTIERENIEFEYIEGRFVVILFPDGKTGQRRVILKDTAAVFAEYLKKIKAGRVFDMSYFQFRHRLAGIEQGIDVKKLRAHRFRHTRATFLANYLTDSELCVVHGWKIGSRMVGTYVEMSGLRKQLDHKIMRIPQIPEVSKF